MDHKTLKNFDAQKDLLKRQAIWMEYLSQYNYKINFIKKKDNSVADALSWMPDNKDVIVGHMLTLDEEETMLEDIKEGYRQDPYTKHLLGDAKMGMLPSEIEFVRWSFVCRREVDHSNI